MKNIQSLPIKLPKSSKFWLLGVAVGLIIVHLNLIWKTENTSLLDTSFLCWAAVLFLLWRKRDTLSRESDLFSIFLGTALISSVILTSAFFHSHTFFLRISPLLLVLGLGLFASGIKGLKQYWQGLIVLCLLAIPDKLIVGMPLLTAKFTALVLMQLGLDVSQEGVYIFFSTGAIEVYPGCSGVVAMRQLLILALLFLVVFPTKLLPKILVPIVAVFVAFIVNGFRISLLALLVASHSAPAFEYWHTGEGAHIFSMISVLVFGLFCYCLLPQAEFKNQETE